ncbi:hypothetical protein R5R35_000114 [Gryllus longicercus]|uniref:CHK kinase-like domain-containing protein n=1 Tax=Gryllus longicercus TaxID=2509291 RepID=A0AAN9VHN6_9ORTH
MTQHSMTTPSWLNEDFIKTAILGETHSDRATLIKYHVAPAAAPGDNYISDIYRVSVETQDGNQFSLIVKCLPTTEYNLQFIRTARLFEKEIILYDSVLPLMCELEKCVSVRFAPKCYFIRSHSVLVLDDLTRQGFKIVDRREGLNLNHCKEAMKCLAYFHACSTALPKEMMISNFCDTVYSGAGQAHARSYVTNCVLSVADRVDKWPGYERFGDKLRNIASSSSDRVVSLFNSESPFRVLNHGDFWTNNIMFQHSSEGDISGIKIIDFQMCRFVSPVFDILYFLYTSPQEEIRLNHRLLLLDEYCKEFTSVAQRLNLPVSITTDLLDKAMVENEFYGFINAIMMLPAVLSGPEKTPDLENVAQGKSEMEWLSGERFRHQFQNILDEFERKGCI